MFPTISSLLFMGGLALLLTFSSNTQAQTTFQDVATSIGINHYHQTDDMGGGVAIFDYNNDSFPDIFYTGGFQRAALYQNNQDGTFTDVTLAAGLGFTDSVAFIAVVTGDIDNDGYRDIYLGTEREAPNYLLKNNGNGTFSDITNAAGVAGDSAWTITATFGDYNKDGFLDLYIGNYVDTSDTAYDSLGNFLGFTHVCHTNILFKNNGDGTFSDVTTNMDVADVGCTLATVFTDYDSDGDVDLFTANDFGQWIVPNALYQNNYPSPYSNESVASNMDAKMFGMGIAIGDYDQDLDLDYYVTNIGRNILQKNNGNGTFMDSTQAAGIENKWAIQDSLHATGWGTGFMDIDNDSYLDLYVANGLIYAIPELLTSHFDPDKLYHNNGDGTFSDLSHLIPVDSMATSRGFAFGDYDNDGDIDLFPLPSLVDHNHDTIKVLVLRNDLNNNNNWLKVDLEGTISNRDAFGAQIYIYTNGKSWVHEVFAGGSHCSQHSSVAHFGLGTAPHVDSLVIHWPNGLTERLSNIVPNQTLYLTEGLVTHHASIAKNSIQFLAFPNPAQDQLNIHYHLPNPQTTSLEISNSIGQVLWQQEYINQAAGEQQLSIPTTALSNGIYVIHLKTADQQLTHKIVIQH